MLALGVGRLKSTILVVLPYRRRNETECRSHEVGHCQTASSHPIENRIGGQYSRFCFGLLCCHTPQCGVSNWDTVFPRKNWMHIPDGYLSVTVSAATGALAIGAVGLSLRQIQDRLADRVVPLTGMMSAMIFAGQMVNFPLPGVPVSGHLIGGVLAAAVLGPWAGCLAITSVLLVQWALFCDGGMLALGANVLNMAVCGAWGGFAVYTAMRRVVGTGLKGTVASAVVASWLSVMAAACLFCVEFGMSWSRADLSLGNIFALIVSYHAVIGLGEALITGAVISFVWSHRPDLLQGGDGAKTHVASEVGRFVTAGLATSIAIAAFLAPFASEHPDGLEAVAEQTGISQLATTPSALLLEDYEIPAISQMGWQRLSVSLAGIGGTAAVVLLAGSLGAVLRRPAISAADDD